MTELKHYGVKGMKWGVRRYQKKNESLGGTYTKRGIEDFDKRLSKYETAKAKYKSAKRESNDKSKISETRRDYKTQKRLLKRDYKQVKADYYADKGKELYRKGKTITGNMQVNAIAQTGIVAGSIIANSLLRNMGDYKTASIVSSTIAIGGTAVNALLAAKTSMENRQLRAYYGHSRKRNN